MVFSRPPVELGVHNVGIFVAALVLGIIWYLRPKSAHPGPPGPRPLPVLGNVIDIDTSAPWIAFTRWKSQYGAFSGDLLLSNKLISAIGDIIGLRALGNNIVVLNSLKTINDFLDKRGSNNSHRPVFTVVGELMELDKVRPDLLCLPFPASSSHI